jgi:uncharacterized membrane protein YjjP (DUF1212 family)
MLILLLWGIGNCPMILNSFIWGLLVSLIFLIIKAESKIVKIIGFIIALIIVFIGIFFYEYFKKEPIKMEPKVLSTENAQKILKKRD